MSDSHIMLFDLYEGGHHGQYIEQLARYWVENGLGGRLSIVIPSQCAERWGSLSALIRENPGSGVEVVRITERVDIAHAGYLRLLRNDLTHGRLLKRYIYRIRPDRCLIMYFDHAQISLALGLRFPFPLTISGIYFRPTFHYGSFLHTQLTWKERLQGIRKRLMLKAALSNRNFGMLYCLDPYVVPVVNSFRNGGQAIFLPDGADIKSAQDNVEQIRRQWGVGADLKVILIFGALDYRKGLLETLDSMLLLPEGVQKQICLVLAGPIAESLRGAAYERLENIKKRANVEVVTDDRFVPVGEVQNLVAAADLVLVTYQRHVGSSNVLVRAAASSKPVIASDFGVVGEHVRRLELGMAIDTTRPEKIAGAISQFVESASDFPFNATTAKQYGYENSDIEFARTIFSSMGLCNVTRHLRTHDPDEQCSNA